MKRRTILLVASFALFATSFLSAQISTGVSIGVLSSNLKSDLFRQDQAGLGYRVGFDFALPLGNHLEFMPSIAYAVKGASAEATYYRPESGLTVLNYDFDYQVFQSQMMVGVKPMRGVRIQAGAFLDAMSNNLPKEQNFTFLGDLTKSHLGIPVSTLNESFSGLDYGAVFGLSLGNNRLRFNAQYMHGMANLYNYSNLNASGHSLKSRTFSLGATYFFIQ